MPITQPTPHSYFARHFEDFRWTRQSDDRPGLRRPQTAALHAIGAHFGQRLDRAIITMPTGSGKTAVMGAAPFLLEANRILILAPSRLVREQIVEDLAAFTTLKKLGVLPEAIEFSRVWNAMHRIDEAADWEALRDCDIVVGTPASLSPGSFGIPDPPADLFDLVLVDEAHHAPAATWAALLDHFRDARQILFTATPFRSDQQEIKGRFIYTYDLRQAWSCPASMDG